MTTNQAIDQDHAMHEEMINAEREWIAKRRALSDSKSSDISDSEYVGLGLSGGGIRSAVFNLGLLQSMERHGLLQQVDYMSTVSGGGYIGSCMTWLKSIHPELSPFGDSRDKYDGRPGEVLSWIRSHGKFLTAGDGLSIWSLVAALLTGTIINLLVVIPPLLLVIYALTLDLPFVPPNLFDIEWLRRIMHGANDGFALEALAGVIAFAAFIVLTALYVLSTSVSAFRNHRRQRAMRVWQGRLLMFGMLFLVIGTVPIVHGLALMLEQKVIESVDSTAASWKSFVDEVFAGFTFLAGLITMAFAKPDESAEGKVSNSRKMLFSIGLVFLIFGLFLMGFDLMKDLSDPNPQVGTSLFSIDESLFSTAGFQICLAISLFLAIFINVNEVSMHRYYRNRLMEAFMPLVGGDDVDPKIPDPETFPVHRAEPVSDAPYQLINTSVNMVGSTNIKLQGRGADNFILSPLYCGSFSSGYAETKKYVGGTLDLATACSISGAAVDPNSYATRSRPVSFLMSLLNIRLGYWIRNPRFPAKIFPSLSRPRWYIYLLREMLGSGLNENHRHVHLSDGGHFENLGLYELIRRKCKYIIVSDAGGDPDYSFPALAKVIQMVRVDFGAQIDLDVSKLEPVGERRFSEESFVLGNVRYPNDVEQGRLIYIKPVVLRAMSEDIHGYRRTHPIFPQESTANQFFAETQFEAYRELGFQIGRQLCHSIEGKSIVSLFQSADSKLSDLVIKHTGKVQQ